MLLLIKEVDMPITFNRRRLALLLAFPVAARAAPPLRLIVSAAASEGASELAAPIAAALHATAETCASVPLALTRLREASGPALLLAGEGQIAHASGLAPVAWLGLAWQVLVVRTDHGAEYFYEFIDWARQQQSCRVAVAEASPGASALALELSAASGFAARVLPHVSAGAALGCLLAGEAEAAILPPAILADAWSAGGALRALVTDAPSRLPVFSAIETLDENGLGELGWTETLGLWARAEDAPALMPLVQQALIDRWSVLAAAMRRLGITPVETVAT
jgi:tripartite-type tricarboxylate transporter receptor subunit TctC